MRLKAIMLALSAALILIGGSAFGMEAVTEDAKLLASDGAAGDEFGDSVSISGDVALVGAPGNDDKGTDSGKAYVFRWNGSSWVEEQKLLASEGDTEDEFGTSVSISGDVALVGADEDDDDDGVLGGTGSAYVFRWNGSSWVEEQKLLASDGAAGDMFGTSVSISGDVALIGAADEGSDTKKGKVYVFRWNGSSWVEEQKLLASDGVAGDVFGTSVSISGDVAVVGATEEEKSGPQFGKAYVFRWNGSSWVEEQKLLASDGDTDDEFGCAVSISGDVAVVGAEEDNDKGAGSGSAYIFRWNGSSWMEEQKLLASDGAAGDDFGVSVSISGNVALVGAPGEDNIVPYSGKVYVFRWNSSNWVEEQKLLASDGAAADMFGTSVSISGNVALVGADEDEKIVPGSGKAYVYALEEQFVVDFSANRTRGPAPMTVSFTDQSTGSNSSWEWNFGDGLTSNTQNPSHTYTDPGTYTVSLTVTGPEGSDTNTKADYIKVTSTARAMPWIPLLLLDD